MTYELPDGPFEPNALIIYGGGGHGKSLIDLLRALGTFQIVGLIDDGLEAGSEVMGITVFGGGTLLAPFAERGLRLAVNAVGGVGDIGSRVRVFDCQYQRDCLPRLPLGRLRQCRTWSIAGWWGDCW
jgi:hypothetical protein